MPNSKIKEKGLREQSLYINRARLSNCIPKKLWEVKLYQAQFQYDLDQYLKTIQNKPRIGNLIPEAVCQVFKNQSNSLTARRSLIAIDENASPQSESLTARPYIVAFSPNGCFLQPLVAFLTVMSRMTYTAE